MHRGSNDAFLCKEVPTGGRKAHQTLHGVSLTRNRRYFRTLCRNLDYFAIYTIACKLENGQKNDTSHWGLLLGMPCDKSPSLGSPCAGHVIGTVSHFRFSSLYLEKRL